MKKNLWRVGKLEKKYVNLAIDGGLTGKYTKEFEKLVCEKFGCRYAIAVNSGTSALHVSMLALGIGIGDEVIVPPLTFIATAYAPIYVGATPIFVDIDPDTFNIDTNKIVSKITKKTKAIIPVSLYGLPSDLISIKHIAKKYNLKIIEDNAECVFGKINDKTVGNFGDISIYSLQRSKHLTSGDGGIITTNDADLAEKCRKYADLGYRTLTAESITNEDLKESIQQPDFKRHELIGYNYRMPEVCAAIGIAQLIKLNDLIEKRIKIGAIFMNIIKDCSWLIPQKTPSNFINTYWTFVVKLDKKSKITWNVFRKKFLDNGGDSFYGAWSLSYNEPVFKSIYDINQFENNFCPIAEDIQPQLIQFKTNYQYLEEAKQQSKILKKTIKQLTKLYQ